MSTIKHSARRDHSVGILYALGAFGIWGAVLPIYMKVLAGVSVLEILGHRIVWAALFAALLITIFGRWREVRQALTPRSLALLMVSATLITVNWVAYIIGVTDGRIVETSLGYFMTPLVNVALGTLVLGERLRRLQLAACLIAAIGVAIPIVGAGGIPWISLSLAFSFGCYGLVRKIVPVESLVGFLVEATILTPVAGGYLLWLAARGDGAFALTAPLTDLLLIGAGVITALPLIWFAAAARKLPLSMIGLLQYSAPSCSFLLGVFAYGEPFTPVRAATFACIWSALALYSIDMVRAQQRMARPLATRNA